MMKNKEDRIIYIGKAKNLRKRVLTYFTQGHSHDLTNWKTMKLIRKIQDIDFLVTDNEIEAFLLESNLIKQYRPLFNIDLKDQQRYTYVKISDEQFPRLLVARRNRDGKFMGPKGRVYGPFVHGSSKFLTIGLLRKIFKVRICNRLPKKPCLEYFINNCDAPCINNVTQNEYMNNIDSLVNILQGRKSIDDFIEKMKEDMDKVKKVDWENVEKEMSKAKEEMEKIGPKIEKEMEKTKVELQNAKEEMKEYKSFVDGLEKDGLIKKSEGYSLRHKDGELFINGKKASNETYLKYKDFLEKHKTFRIEKSDDDFNIDVD